MTSDHKTDFYDVILSVWYPLLSFSFTDSSVGLYKSVTHIIIFITATLVEPREMSEDEDSDFSIINDESDEDDNRFRQEYDINRTRIRFR